MQVREIINQEDPLGLIEPNENLDEYEPEAALILARIDKCQSESEIYRIVLDVFNKMFGEDIGPKAAYKIIAERVWRLTIAFMGRGVAPACRQAGGGGFPSGAQAASIRKLSHDAQYKLST